MSASLLVFFFALGAIVGSFVGVVAARINTGQGIAHGRSRCDACGTPLSVRSLVPIFSYVLGRGRARCCSVRLSALSPVSEFLFGVLFVLFYSKLGLTLALAVSLIAVSLLGALVLYDMAHQILPPLLVALFVAASFSAVLLENSGGSFLSVCEVAVLLAFILAAVHWASRGRAMGLSDAPLALGLALLTGPAAFPGFVFSFWIGAVIGIAILFGHPHGSRMGIEVPFAPFLAGGFLLAYFTQWNPFILVNIFS